MHELLHTLPNLHLVHLGLVVCGLLDVWLCPRRTVTNGAKTLYALADEKSQYRTERGFFNNPARFARKLFVDGQTGRVELQLERDTECFLSDDLGEETWHGIVEKLGSLVDTVSKPESGPETNIRTCTVVSYHTSSRFLGLCSSRKLPP